LLPPMVFPSDFSKANLKVGRSLPAKSGSGTLFMNVGSPAATRPVPAIAAVAAAANPDARKSRRFGMGSHCWPEKWRRQIWDRECKDCATKFEKSPGCLVIERRLARTLLYEVDRSTGRPP